MISSAATAAQRVVSMNLCTDQLAMLLTGPKQLISVSSLAADPQYSTMAQEARAYHLNRGQAEEIAFLRPDLVLAGQYTTQATVDMIKRLGYHVEIFEPENSIADIKRNLRKMGAVLGQIPRAEALIAQMDHDLAQIDYIPEQQEALLYYASGYTSGSGSLADDILRHAGLKNKAVELGLPAGGTLSLEDLILSAPQVLLRGQSYATPSRGQEMLTHPALQKMLEPPRKAYDTGPEWTCGTPATLAMIADLAAKVHKP